MYVFGWIYRPILLLIILRMEEDEQSSSQSRLDGRQKRIQS